jgi:hypothetical protein
MLSSSIHPSSRRAPGKTATRFPAPPALKRPILRSFYSCERRQRVTTRGISESQSNEPPSSHLRLPTGQLRHRGSARHSSLCFGSGPAISGDNHSTRDFQNPIAINSSTTGPSPPKGKKSTYCMPLTMYVNEQHLSPSASAYQAMCRRILLR